MDFATSQHEQNDLAPFLAQWGLGAIEKGTDQLSFVRKMQQESKRKLTNKIEHCQHTDEPLDGLCKFLTAIPSTAISMNPASIFACIAVQFGDHLAQLMLSQQIMPFIDAVIYPENDYEVNDFHQKAKALGVGICTINDLANISHAALQRNPHTDQFRIYLSEARIAKNLIGQQLHPAQKMKDILRYYTAIGAEVENWTFPDHLTAFEAQREGYIYTMRQRESEGEKIQACYLFNGINAAYQKAREISLQSAPAQVEILDGYSLYIGHLLNLWHYPAWMDRLTMQQKLNYAAMQVTCIGSPKTVKAQWVEKTKQITQSSGINFGQNIIPFGQSFAQSFRQGKAQKQYFHGRKWIASLPKFHEALLQAMISHGGVALQEWQHTDWQHARNAVAAKEAQKPDGLLLQYWSSKNGQKPICQFSMIERFQSLAVLDKQDASKNNLATDETDDSNEDARWHAIRLALMEQLDRQSTPTNF